MISHRTIGVRWQLLHHVAALLAVVTFAACSSALRSSDIELGAEADAGEALGGDGGVDGSCACGAADGNPNLPFYRDADGDGYGDPGAMNLRCSAGGGYVADNTDCDDGDDSSYPGNPEVCDGADNSCAGGVDEGNPGGGCDADANVRSYCSGGSIMTESCNSGYGNTCYLGACMGSCIASQWSCVSGESTRQFCQLDGTPGTTDPCDDDNGGENFAP